MIKIASSIYPRIRESGATSCLWVASRMGHEGAVRELFESGVDVDEVGADGHGYGLMVMVMVMVIAMVMVMVVVMVMVMVMVTVTVMDSWSWSWS